MDGFQVPPYTLEQTETSVSITITLPRTASAPPPSPGKMAVSSPIFAFHCDDHYLPLVFPSALVTPSCTDVEPASTTDDRAIYILTLLKGSQGMWQGLDALQPQLMPEEVLGVMESDIEANCGMFAPSSASASTEAVHQGVQGMLNKSLKSAGLIDLDAPAPLSAASSVVPPALSTSVPALPSMEVQPARYSYGFGNRFSGPFLGGAEIDVRNILEVAAPSSLAPDVRSAQAEAWENDRWDEGIYLDNFLDFDGELAALVSSRRPPAAVASRSTSGGQSDKLDGEATSLLLQLLFGFLYELQTNHGETTVESSWTIAKLSRTLCSFSFPPPLSTDSEEAGTQVGLHATLRAILRRALVVPLYRHWQLSLVVLSELVNTLRGGRAAVLPVLASISDLFASEPVGTAVLSRLDDVWIRPLSQTVAALDDDGALVALADRVQGLLNGGSLSKELVGGEEWDLEVSEQAARMAVDEGEGGFV